MALIQPSVAGVGCVSPLASNWPDTWKALCNGSGAIQPIRRFDPTGYPCQVGAPTCIDSSTSDPRWMIARIAVDEAWATAGAPPGRLGVFVGAESGRARFHEVIRIHRAAGGGRVFDAHRFGRDGRPFAKSMGASIVSPAAIASQIARRFAATGPVETVSLACASGLAAIIEAVHALQAGACDVAIAGGVGADLDPFMLAGFGKLGALSAKGISRPFDLRRDGFVIGEGAAFVVLTVNKYPIRIGGSARTLDAWHLTQPDPTGAGAERAMSLAWTQAKLPPIGHIQAHGTSTPANDAAEVKAIRSVWSTPAPVSSVKGAVGHWIAGAGALGFLCAVESVRSGQILPTLGVTELDPLLPIDLVTQVRAAVMEAAVVNAFAFGGANASVVVIGC